MKVFDLTRGGLPDSYMNSIININVKDTRLNAAVGSVQKFPDLFCPSNDAWKTTFDNIPVFLVDTSMANEYSAVPGCQCSVRVPEDLYKINVPDKINFEDWLTQKEREIDGKERSSEPMSIYDLLGVYIHTSEKDVMPHRIFIWIDKIKKYVDDHNGRETDLQDLFELVVYHELAHALMNVELYNIQPTQNFSYQDDCVYRYIEEAYANGVALKSVFYKILQIRSHRTKNERHLTTKEKHLTNFISNFVESQGAGYSFGLELFEEHSIDLTQWMAIKVLFNYEFALLIKDWYLHGTHLLSDFVKGAGHPGWIEVKDRHGKWSIIDIFTKQPVSPSKND